MREEKIGTRWKIPEWRKRGSSRGFRFLVTRNDIVLETMESERKKQISIPVANSRNKVRKEQWVKKRNVHGNEKNVTSSPSFFLLLPDRRRKNQSSYTNALCDSFFSFQVMLELHIAHINAWGVGWMKGRETDKKKEIQWQSYKTSSGKCHTWIREWKEWKISQEEREKRKRQREGHL